MFTGVIKLAQIDDYINPSQSCIQPKIMKPTPDKEKATVTLNDCLACSGCITSAESILVEQMSIQKLIEKIKYNEDQIKQQMYIIISPQSLLSLCQHYNEQVTTMIKIINAFFTNLFPSFKCLVDLQVGIKLCHELIWQEYQRNNNKTILCTQCPGWVCYAQKTLNSNITQLMSNIKSPQQILGRILKNYHKNDDKRTYVVGIMPCYDKKLEAIRFDFGTEKEVDLTITSGQFKVFIERLLLANQQKTWEQFAKQVRQKQIITSQIIDTTINKLQLTQKNVSFINDQSSNGYISYILQKLNVKYEEKTTFNSDFIQYTFNDNRKMAKCYGFRNIQKIVGMVKKKKCPYEYVQIMACPGGCYAGGGQLKVQNKKVKQSIEQFKKISEKFVINREDTNKLKELYLIEEVTVNYKPIQNSLSVNVSNW